MLLKQPILEGIAAGSIDLAFRRWTRPTVKQGGTLRTAIGVLSIERVEVVSETQLLEREAKRAGFESVEALLASLRDEGVLYRITLRLAGSDPRVALRESRPTATELQHIVSKLAAIDDRSASPWTAATLRLIGRSPATLAATLANELCMERLSFKRNVRKLKELGLTESLEVGYKLSPRGKDVLAALNKP